MALVISRIIDRLHGRIHDRLLDPGDPIAGVTSGGGLAEILIGMFPEDVASVVTFKIKGY